MKLANDYLKELLGVDVFKLEIKVQHLDQWEYFTSGKPEGTRGDTQTEITFETIERLTRYDYGSIQVIGFDSVYREIYDYRCVCKPGKETQELFSYLGGKRDD